MVSHVVKQHQWKSAGRYDAGNQNSQVGKSLLTRASRSMNLKVEQNRMCRNIKTLFNFDPPVSEEETRAAALQYVRKITGFNKPSKANEAAFGAAVDEIAAISRELLTALETNAAPRNREEEAAKAKARAVERFGDSSAG